jgi:hypothetical protein
MRSGIGSDRLGSFPYGILPERIRPDPPRYISLYILFRNGFDPIPELVHPVQEWTRPYPTRYRSLNIIYDVEPIPSDQYPRLCISFRNGPDPIRPDTEAYTHSPGMDPFLSDPIPERMLFLSGMDAGPIRSDPIRYRTYTNPSGMYPTRSVPIPELTHHFPEWTRPYPTRYRSLYIMFRSGTDPIRSDNGACASHTGMNPIRTRQIPKLIHPLPEWIRSYPIRCRSSYIHYTSSSDPVRPDTGAYTSMS